MYIENNNDNSTLLVESIVVEPATVSLPELYKHQLTATVYPESVVNKEVRWHSENEDVATVNPSTGVVFLKKAGETTTIYATACDGSEVYGTCQVTVGPPIPVEGVDILHTDISMKEDERKCLDMVIYPANASNKAVMWCSSNPSVASVGLYTGEVWATSPGTATITATTLDGRFTASCEIWVKGKTPVFLLHGRTSNSFDVWGAGNSIFVDLSNIDIKDNNHYNSDVNARVEGNNQLLYTSKTVQDLLEHETGLPMVVDDVEVQNFVVPAIFNGQFKEGKYSTEHPEGGNLACRLWQEGYKANVNLFVFNYPNRDAVVHSAKKFEAYIDNLIDFVRSNGDDEMKCCFYDSKEDYEANNYKINLVGHSMGGLVSRYYIENLGQDSHVDKLITICTPHWGSGYAQLSNATGISHALCDHDLDFNSAMFGGENPETLDCDAFFSLAECVDGDYALTDELQYSKPRVTRYYAIAGIDYNASEKDDNDVPIDLPNYFTTYQQIADYMTQNEIYKRNLLGQVAPMNVIDFGDNMVGFMSQIGWKEDGEDSPSKKVRMERIFVDVDTNGGNGGEVFIWEAIGPGQFGNNILHTKMPHREAVFRKIDEYLAE